jgi:hypothetical protein
MLLVQVLLRAISQGGRYQRAYLALLPMVALVVAIGAALSGAHPLHMSLLNGAHLLASSSVLISGGGPPNP